MWSLRDTHRTRPFGRVWATLSVLLLGSAGYLDSLSLAQTVCSENLTSPVRVQTPNGVGTLREALNCVGGGIVEADWAGYVTVDVPIEIAEGTFLSVTGVDGLAEAHADGDQTNKTRLFEVSHGGGLTLTGLKLSGGSAGEGGAIHSRSANLTLENCTFEGNVATDGNGGAVWAEGGNVTIVGGEFSANHATRYGGAVHSIDGSLTVRGGSMFEGNTAIAGGALFCGLGDVGPETPAALCSIADAEFVSNSAAREEQDSIDDFSYLDGGGAAMFLFATVSITDSVFSGNYARLTGGALHGGLHTNFSINGCTLGNNTSGKYGGAISASSMTLGGGTQLTNNSAVDDGGAVLGWDANGTVVFNDMFCTENTAYRNGGCIYATGNGIVNDGTAMAGNVAELGGSILAHDGSDITVYGGRFTSGSTARGGFLYAEGNTRVKITGGLIERNLASKKGAGLYVNGNEASDISIEGGTFRENEALESGGAIAVWGEPGLVKITGGTFEKNKATFYGGFVFVESEATFTCEQATVTGNYAGDQGGGIYAREATWVNSTCDLIENTSPQGAAIYLTNVKSATFEDHNVTDNLASGGSVVFLAASPVVAKEVTFGSRIGLQDFSFNRAIQMDDNTTLDAEKCVFEGWLGDAVVLNLNPTSGSLILDSCDFSRSSAVLAVVSPNSKAVIRNAVVSSVTFENTVEPTLDNPLTLVDRALDCSDPNACGAGECVNSTLGVLCVCLEGGECLDDGGDISLSLQTRPDAETILPKSVSYELMVSTATVGTTYAIWDLTFEADDLSLDVFPSSGVLPPGGSVLVQVTGTSMNRDVGGNLTSSFAVTSVGSVSSDPAAVVMLDVYSTFYLCGAYEYALPGDGDDDENIGDISCLQCTTITGEEGVSCESPGATKALLPIKPGYWRSSRDSMVVHECLHSDACMGATEVSSSDDYCADGYRGPYCAVCAEGYGGGVTNACHYCDNATAHALVTVGTLFSLVVLLLLLLAVVFLIGGLDAIDSVRQTVSRTILFRSNAPASVVPVPKSSLPGGNDHESNTEYWMYPGGEATDGAPIHSPRSREVSAGRHARGSAVAEVGTSISQTDTNMGVEATGRGGKSRGCGIGDKVKGWVSRLPLDKLKILVVVWQILTIFSSISGVQYPASYSRFLVWINVVNLDIGDIFSASCIWSSANFYVRLLLTTLAPLVLAGVLVLTYHMAKNRAGIGSAGVIARRAAWSRHMAAGLLLTFLVFTSASTVAFKTLSCDSEVVEGESYLRADYSISCKSRLHTFFQVYACFMILVYPIGIPVLYAAILWNNRELLNPRLHTTPDGAMSDEPERGDAMPSTILSITPKDQARNSYSSEELRELEEKVKARRDHPKLVPSMFLWKDFGPDLYYFEVIECGRRILLTGVLIFIKPHSPTQAAMACIFAFASLLGFELLRPHMDPTDSWLYRLGCVIIFLSNFLALLIQVDVGEADDRDVFGALLVFVNVLLVLAVLVTSWFATQQSVDDSRDEENSFTLAKTMLTAEQYAANSARLARESGKARTSLASSSIRPGLPPSDPGLVWRGPTPLLHQGSGATDSARSDVVVPSLGSDSSAYAAMLAEEKKCRGYPGSEAIARPTPPLSATMF